MHFIFNFKINILENVYNVIESFEFQKFVSLMLFVLVACLFVNDTL